ncbi:SDR family oxidoreductase [Natronohydrobacter thiooxidans]|uniref:SDR family oxidoreductase n=1 Tax=Natronohydrobacter thiooxidans TaxID=87172 RepID=UPI0008FF6573|nr:SDR family oxidoreductase [Natronohydrobacter thiooxidans]
MTGTLLSLGHGYSARALEDRLLPQGWTIIGTTRNPDKAKAMAARGVTPLIWPGSPLPLAQATHLLTSVAPGAPGAGDPVLAAHGHEVAAATHLQWVGYLSTVGVYGDRQGGWVDETATLDAKTPRSVARRDAEAAWQRLCDRAGLRLHIFRLAGIYGPGRGPFEKLRSGRAQMVIKPGQYFSRIHYDDIGQALELAIRSDQPSRIWNLCDDAPAPPQDVLRHASQLLCMDPPPEVSIDEAEMSPMARSFYADSKRVRNDRIKRDLGLKLMHPDYQTGLAAILRSEG